MRTAGSPSDSARELRARVIGNVGQRPHRPTVGSHDARLRQRCRQVVIPTVTPLNAQCALCDVLRASLATKYPCLCPLVSNSCAMRRASASDGTPRRITALLPCVSTRYTSQLLVASASAPAPAGPPSPTPATVWAPSGPATLQLVCMLLWDGHGLLALACARLALRCRPLAKPRTAHAGAPLPAHKTCQWCPRVRVQCVWETQRGGDLCPLYARAVRAALGSRPLVVLHAACDVAVVRACPCAPASDTAIGTSVMTRRSRDVIAREDCQVKASQPNVSRSCQRRR